MGKRVHRKILRRLLQALIVLVAAIGAVLWQLDRELPRFARVRLERALSQGVLSFRFDHASLNLFRGITVRNVRIHVKRTLGPPLIRVGELRLKGNYYRDRPFYTWIRFVEADDFVCQPFFDLPESERGGISLADHLSHCTVENDWFSEPIRVTLRNADIFAIKCRRADFQLYAKNNLVTADAIRLDINSRGFDEVLTGWTTFAPTPCEIRSRLHGTLTPEVVEDFIDFLGGDFANNIARRTDNYTAPMQVSGEVHWRSSPEKGVPPLQDFRATAQGGGLTYRGVPLRDLRFGVQWTAEQGEARRDRHISVGPIEMGFENGSAKISVAWYPSTHATHVHAEANAHPEDLARAIWGKVPNILTNFTFHTIPTITAAGSVMPDGFAEKTFISGYAKVAEASARGVPLKDVSFDFSLHDDDILDFTNVMARAFNGDLGGHVRVSDYENVPNLDMNFALRRADCLQVRRHFLGSDLEGEGTLDAGIDLHGLADSDKLDTLHGSADMAIRGGNILRVPIFAGLTDFIGRNVPGVDLLVMQSDADVNCTLTNGLVTIDNLAVSGNLFSLVASGRCRINKEGVPIDMLAQLRFFHSQSLIGKLARLVTLPVSKMMEFRVTGPISNPDWSYIGVIDRIRSIFWTREDATKLKEEAAKPVEWAEEGSK